MSSKKGFKRDYDSLEEFQTIADKQAAHGSRVAGQIYARGIEEAPGYVQSIQSEYRTVSREWHRCLGFGVMLETRKESGRGQKDYESKTGTNKVQAVIKRPIEAVRKEIEDEVTEWAKLDYLFGTAKHKRRRIG